MNATRISSANEVSNACKKAGVVIKPHVVGGSPCPKFSAGRAAKFYRR